MTSFKKKHSQGRSWRFSRVFVSQFFIFFLFKGYKLQNWINKKNKPWQSLLLHTVIFSFVICYYCNYKLYVYCKRFQSRKFTCILLHANTIRTVSNIHTLHQDKTHLWQKKIKTVPHSPVSTTLTYVPFVNGKMRGLIAN